MSQCYSIIIDRGISVPGHGKDVVDGLNDVDNCSIFGNRSIYIEGIALENFSAVPQADINSSTISHQRHAVLQYFFI